MINGKEFKNAMRQHLKATQSEFSDSDMLIDFCEVMINNSKPREYVETQLLDLTSELEAKEITEWLFSWLHFAQAPAAVSQPPARAFQLALHQANVDTQHLQSGGAVAMEEDRADHEQRRPKKDLRDRLKKGGDLRNLLSRGGSSVDAMDVDQGSSGPQRKDRRTERNSPYASASSTRIREKRDMHKSSAPVVKCSFWPNCNREDCPFHHPSEPCPDGDQCEKGKACLFIHQVPAATACKYAEQCTNPHCTFSHPSPASIALAKASKMAQIACKYFPNCLNQQCPFLHDPALLVAAPATSVPTAPIIAPSDTPLPESVQTICKFDPHCNRFGCYYVHPSRAQQPSTTSASKTWINPNLSNSERKFVSNEVTETMQVDNIQ